jgi:hypothetical protein
VTHIHVMVCFWVSVVVYYEEIKREIINRIFIIYDGLCYERRVFGKFIYSIKKTKTEGRRCRTKTMTQ